MSGAIHQEMNSLRRQRFPEPAPSRTILGAGAGWGYGFGCGVGPFLGMGVSASPGTVLFGAGLGLGAYCGVGFGAGFVTGIGSFYVPKGVISRDIFYPPPAVKAFIADIKIRLRMLLVDLFKHSRLARILYLPHSELPRTRWKFGRNGNRQNNLAFTPSRLCLI